MTSDRVNTGAKAFLKSLAIAEEGKERELIRIVVTYTGWLLLLFVWVIYLLSPELRAREAWIYRWLSAYLAYQIVVTTLGRIMKRFYETPGVRMARIQVMMFLASALVLLTGGAESYFWFVYLLPLLAAALYFSWPVTWGIYGEVAVLYFLSSLVAVGGFASISFALLLTNLAVLLVLTVVLRYLMESVTQHQAAKRALRYSELLQQVQQDVDAAINLQEVLNKILQRAVNWVRARDGSLMLMEEAGRLHFRARVGGLFPVGKEDRTFMPGAPDEGIAGWVARNREPYVCRDTKTDTQFVDIIAGGVPIRSLVSVPIISHGVVLGVISVDSSEPDRFSAADAELLVALANQVAVAIERAELLESLQQIGEKSLRGAEDLHQHIVDVVHRLTRCPVSMWRVDETGHQARIVASRNISAKYVEEARLDLDQSVTGQAIRERLIIQVLDIQANPDFQNKEAAAGEGWQSILVVPLFAGPERAVGTLSIYSMTKREEFTRWELDLLRACAGQAGVAIQNAERLQTIHRLNEVGQSLAVLQESPEVLQETLERIAHTPMEVLGADVVDLYQYRADRDDFVLPPIMVGERRFPHLVPRRVFMDDVVVKIVHAGEKIYALDAQEHPVLAGDWEAPREERPKERFVVREEIISSAVVPMKVGEQVLGVMFASYRQRRDFDTDVELREKIEVLANQGAIGISNARLFEEKKKGENTLGRLLQIGQEMSRLALQEPRGVLEQIARSVCEKVGADCAVIYPYDRARKGYFDTSNVASYGLWHPLVLADKPRDGGMAARIRQAGMREIPDVSQEDPRLNPPLVQREGIQAFVGISLRADDEEVGVMYVNFRHPHKVSEDERKVILRYAEDAVKGILKGRQATGVQLRTLLGQIAQNAKELLEADLVILYQYRRGRDEEFMTPPVSAGEFREPGSMGRKILENDVPALLVKRGEPYYADDLTKDEFISKISPMVEERDAQPSRPRFIVREDIRSSAGVLLRAEGEIVGVMFINYRAPRSFAEEVRREIDLFAGQAAVAIRSARILEQTEVLREIGQAIAAATLEPERLLGLILERVLDLVGFSKGWISLLDARTGVLEMRAARGLKRDEWRSLEKGKGIGGHVVDTGEYMNVPDVSKVPFYEEFFKDTKSDLCVPLKYRDRVLGVLNLESAREAAFTRRDEELMIGLASEAAIAIENARLYEQLQEELRQTKVLYVIGQALSAELDYMKILRLILEGAKEIIPFERGDIVLIDEHSKELVSMSSIGLPERAESLRTKIGEGITGWVAKHGQPLCVNDVNDMPQIPNVPEQPGYLELDENTKSELCVPLRAKRHVIGVLNVESHRVGAFNERDQEQLETLATQAAIAIQNARLHADLERHIERLQTLNQVSRELSAKLDKESIFETVVKAIVRTLNCTHCTFFVLENNSLVPCASHTKGKEAKVTRRFALGEGLAGWVAQTGKAILARDAKKLVRFSKGKTRPEVDRSMIVVPVKVDDQILGVISLDQDRLNAFSEEDQHLAEALAAQASVAFLTAELLAEAQAGLQERVDDIRALQDIYALMGTTPLNDMLQQIAGLAARLTPAKYTEVWLLDRQARELQFGAGNGGEEEMTRGLRTLSLGETSINARVALTRKTYLCNDVEGDPYYKAWYADTRSELAAPLMHSGKVIGTLNLESTEVGAFADDHKRLVEALAGAVTVAIQNARLYEKIRALNEVGRVLTSGIRLREAEVLELIHSQASKLMNTHNMYIALYDEATDTVRFGLAFVDGRRVDVDSGKDWQSRKASKGRAEWIIHNLRPILISTKAEAEAWYKQPGREEQVGRDFEPSWLGVPMMVGEKVLGVIATYHPTWSYMFGTDDLEVLQAMASEAAIALDNANQVQLRIEAERRAYLADLAQTTAHHLKNELGSIRPMAEIMIEDADLDLPADYRKSLEMICTNASSAERLVARLFAPFRDLSLGQIGVDCLIIEARNSASPLLSGIGVAHSCPESLPAVYVDRLGTVGVFAELLTNAQEAIKRGSRPGRIDVIASLSKDQDWVEVQFANNGPPIPPELQAVLFEPRKGIETSGFGLGLWSARVLLEREGGSIHLLKSDEQGASFLVRLPVSQQEL